MTQQPEQKKNFNGGECTCDKFVNCHDCRDMNISHVKYREKVLDDLLNLFKWTNKAGNFRPWDIGHIESVISEYKESLWVKEKEP